MPKEDSKLMTPPGAALDVNAVDIPAYGKDYLAIFLIQCSHTPSTTIDESLFVRIQYIKPTSMYSYQKQ